MDRRAFLRTVGCLSSVGLAGCAGLLAGPSGQHAAYDVGMSTMDFRPASVSIDVGETVVWKNTSSHGHTVTAYEDSIPDGAEYFASGGFESEEEARESWFENVNGALFTGDTFEHTFDVAGEYHYFCIPHEPMGMLGEVIVSENSTESPQQ